MGIFSKKANSVADSEELKIKKLVTNILKKDKTTVKVSPRSSKYIIRNESNNMRILIDSGAERIKTVSEIDGFKSNHIWKCRGVFVDELVEAVLDWVEIDRLNDEKEDFLNELEFLDTLIGNVDSLENAKEDIRFEKIAPNKIVGFIQNVSQFMTSQTS
jgi:hypothetical protein